jgi:hypothetical protein
MRLMRVDLCSTSRMLFSGVQEGQRPDTWGQQCESEERTNGAERILGLSQRLLKTLSTMGRAQRMMEWNVGGEEGP